MEFATSKTLNPNPSTMATVVGPFEDAMVQYFQKLRLKDEQGATDTNPSRNKNQRFQQQESSAQTQLYSGNPVSDFNNSIWGYRFFSQTDEAEKRNSSVSNGHNGLFSYEPHNKPKHHHQFRGIERNQPFSEKQKEKMQLDSLVETISLQSESFLNAAFCWQGVTSITKLIRQFKKSDHAATITRILSKKFLELMTHNIARTVIQNCFIHFRHEHNEILYECTINHCHYLAMHKVGCRALNECFSTISGQQRSRLLDSIASISDILCDDQYGNYVLQNVLELKIKDVNAKIFDCLRGKFLQLAQRKAGSHIVEKCMLISETGLLCVIEELLKSPQTTPALAQHSFGNYVVQKALRLTKGQGLIDLYNSLVNLLKPHFPALMKTAGGRKVIDVIKG